MLDNRESEELFENEAFIYIELEFGKEAAMEYKKEKEKERQKKRRKYLETQKKYIDELSKNKKVLKKFNKNKKFFKIFHEAGLIKDDFKEMAKRWQKSKDFNIFIKEYNSVKEMYDTFDVNSLNKEKNHSVVIIYNNSSKKTAYNIKKDDEFFDKVFSGISAWIDFHVVEATLKEHIEKNKIILMYIEYY